LVRRHRAANKATADERHLWAHDVDKGLTAAAAATVMPHLQQVRAYIIGAHHERHLGLMPDIGCEQSPSVAKVHSDDEARLVTASGAPLLTARPEHLEAQVTPPDGVL